MPRVLLNKFYRHEPWYPPHPDSLLIDTSLHQQGCFTFVLVVCRFNLKCTATCSAKSFSKCVLQTWDCISSTILTLDWLTLPTSMRLLYLCFSVFRFHLKCAATCSAKSFSVSYGRVTEFLPPPDSWLIDSPHINELLYLCFSVFRFHLKCAATCSAKSFSECVLRTWAWVSSTPWLLIDWSTNCTNSWFMGGSTKYGK